MNTTKDATMNDLSALVLDQARSANALYLEGYRVGYEAGFEAACKAAINLANKPLGETKAETV
jgi:hypothetical protein